MNKESIADRYRKLYAGVIYDTMEFDLKVRHSFMIDMSVKPGYGFTDVLFGPAFTCKGERVQDMSHIDDTIRLKMFQKFYKGCVQVISSGGFRDVAQFGDISGKIARKFGAAGAVTDAPARDIRLIEQDGFRLFCTGAQCTDAYGKWQITEYEVPVVMPGIHGDVIVSPGDYIFGDPDGVLVIPQNLAESVLKGAEKRLVQENRVREEIYKTDDIVELNNKVGRW